MNFLALQLKAASLAAQAGYSSNFPQPDWGSQINQALSWWSWDTEYNVVTGTLSTVINQAEYALVSPSWKYLSDVYYDTNTILRERTEERIRARDPLWLMQTASQPVWFWLSKPNTLRLHPKPNAVATVTFRGVQEAAPLVADTDTPPYAEEYHYALAAKAALLFLDEFKPDEMDMIRRNKLEARYEELKIDFISWLNSDDGLLVRTITQRQPDNTRYGWSNT